MAIYHCSVKTIGRSTGRSSVAAAAYRAGEKITNEYDGITHDFTRKKGIRESMVLLPENAPREYQNRALLWNAVEQNEKRKDSQLAREIELSLPVELNETLQRELVREYAINEFVSKGMIADISIHDKKDGNPHAHIMLTMRNINDDGFGSKAREWNSKDLLMEWREHWAEQANEYLTFYANGQRIDHRSYADQGKDILPSAHMGVAAAQMERRGIKTEVGNLNRVIFEINYGKLRILNDEIGTIQNQIDAEKMRMAQQQLQKQGGRFLSQSKPNLTRPDIGELRLQLINLVAKEKEIVPQMNQQLNFVAKKITELEGSLKPMMSLHDDITRLDNLIKEHQQTLAQLGAFQLSDKKIYKRLIVDITQDRERMLYDAKKYGVNDLEGLKQKIGSLIRESKQLNVERMSLFKKRDDITIAKEDCENQIHKTMNSIRSMKATRSADGIVKLVPAGDEIVPARVFKRVKVQTKIITAPAKLMKKVIEHEYGER